MACHCHAAMSGLFFSFPLICWGFCSKKLCTPEPYYKLEVSRKELLFALVFFVSTVLFWECGWFTFNPVLSITLLFSFWNTKKTQVLNGVTLDSTVSLPLYYLNRCVFVAPALTATPPRWFISLVGLLAAAGDQTEEPGLSHHGNESEKREGGEEHYCLSSSLSLQPSNTALPYVHATYTHASHFCKP